MTLSQDGNKHAYSGEIFKKETEHKNAAKLYVLGNYFSFSTSAVRDQEHFQASISVGWVKGAGHIYS